MSGDLRAGSDVPREVLDIAARMFAGLGYDNTSVRMIICAGADAEAVAAAGGKTGLYRAVMEHAHESVVSALEPAISQITPDAAGVKRIADAFLNFSIENPAVGALWLHRSLADAADISDLEPRYLATEYEMVRDAVRGAVSLNLDLQMAILTIEWCVYGFIRGGILDDQGRRVGPDDKAVLKRFRKYLHNLIDAILSDGSTPATPAGRQRSAWRAMLPRSLSGRKQ
ncbi:TetR/AcrR family transcriptional regulator [Actinomadura scrupuli]|uniref:TetR/AcrR family transcriptional regulator n=1 Tax=Actinomadura scrupuli TaxID=559629 RepID=UPI003D988065